MGIWGGGTLLSAIAASQSLNLSLFTVGGLGGGNLTLRKSHVKHSVVTRPCWPDMWRTLGNGAEARRAHRAAGSFCASFTILGCPPTLGRAPLSPASSGSTVLQVQSQDQQHQQCLGTGQTCSPSPAPTPELCRGPSHLCFNKSAE